MLKIYVFILLLAAITFTAFGQLPELEMQQVQTSDEIKTVLSLMGKNSDENEIGFLLSLARNYYRMDKYEEAERYFLRVINEPICSDLDYKALAICLLNNHKLSLANEIYGIYRSRIKDNITFTNLWNQVLQDQANKILGSRIPATQYKKVYGNLNEDGVAYLNLENGGVKAELQCNNLSNMVAVQLPVIDLNKLGVYSLGPNNKSYIYSYQESNGFYGLYYVEFVKEKWRKTVRLTLGEDMANYIHPIFQKSTNTLYYSSDKSGSLGGYDLYQVSFDGKSWVDDKNLGKLYNTDKNELLPSFFNNALAFSSNGHPGYGGYDVYQFNANSNSLQILAKPFNSSINDFVIMSKNETNGIVIGGLGNGVNLLEVQKIYVKTNAVTGRIVSTDGQGIGGAHVLFNNAKSPQGTFVESQADGSFKILLPDTIGTWKLQVMHPKYNSNILNTQSSKLNNEPLIISMEAKKTDEPEQVFIVKSPSRNVVPTQPIVKDTPKPETIAEGNANEGSANIYNEIGSDVGRFYVIFGSTRSYESAYSFWEKWKVKFPNAEILEYVDKGVYRVGEYAGLSHNEAMEIYKKAKRVKADVWILKPDVE